MSSNKRSRIKRLWQWAKRKKYVWLTLFAINYCVWQFCLPVRLFEDPTCTVLKDKDGYILGARIAKDGQWRFPASDSIPYKFKVAIIQFEDRDFESHWGISFKAFGRAIQQNFSTGKVVSGGSTITMQTMRLSRKGQSRSYFEKVKEVYLATRLEWRHNKDEILNFYASNAPMGGNVVGIEAASWRYFGRTAFELSWAEAALLAVLPNAPSLLHPGKNRNELFNKRNRLLKRLFEIGELGRTDYELAVEEPIPDKPAILPQLAPHLMNRITQGKLTNSTIDRGIQSHCINTLKLHHKLLSENEVQNGAILVLDIETGGIVGYVGNTSNKDKLHGNDVDVIRAPRSTGSILKPYLYAGMLNDGSIMPSQLIEDVPLVLSGYAPQNYDMKFDGAVPASKALSRSLNVPIVKMLGDYGVPKFRNQLINMGLTTIHRPSKDYGLTLVLGGAEATLWDLCSAYGNMAGILNKANGIDCSLPINFKYSNQYTSGSQFEYDINPASVWRTFQAMVDVTRPTDDVNWETFQSSQKIAWKTGTSFGFRDAWAIGVTSKYVVGVWIGNADGEGRPGLVGVKAAAPVLFDVFDRLEKTDWFQPPFDDMEETYVCRQSGHKSTEYCEEVDTVMVPKSCLKVMPCPYHQPVNLDKTGKFRVHSDCELVHEMNRESHFILPPIIEKYYKQKHPNHKTLPPFRKDCFKEDYDSPIAIIYPKKESQIYVPLTFDEIKSKTVFEATHRDEKAILYWHLDEYYLGETTDIHQLSINPIIGEHVLTIVDLFGNTVSQKFSVIGEESD